MTQHSQAKCVNQGIAFVRFIEVNLAGNGGDSKTIAVVRNASHDTSEETAIISNGRLVIGLGRVRRAAFNFLRAGNRAESQ
jgi:hypothetical protein